MQDPQHALMGFSIQSHLRLFETGFRTTDKTQEDKSEELLVGQVAAQYNANWTFFLGRPAQSPPAADLNQSINTRASPAHSVFWQYYRRFSSSRLHCPMGLRSFIHNVKSLMPHCSHTHVAIAIRPILLILHSLGCRELGIPTDRAYPPAQGPYPQLRVLDRRLRFTFCGDVSRRSVS